MPRLRVLCQCFLPDNYVDDRSEPAKSPESGFGLAVTCIQRFGTPVLCSMQVLEELPTALPMEVALAYCNHGNLARSHAGVDSSLLEEAVLLFQR